jgi:hypothetical protein
MPFDEALANHVRPPIQGAAVEKNTGRPMKGWLLVSSDVLRDSKVLAAVLAISGSLRAALRHVRPPHLLAMASQASRFRSSAPPAP